ncbi:MAG: ABC transporter substrate-binding protein [Syntrophales bacterium]
MPGSRRTTLPLLLIAAAATLFFGCQKDAENTYSGPVEKITFGVVSIEASSLLYIADTLGMFKKHGLEVTVKEYPAGLLATEDLMKDRADVVTASEFVVVTKHFLRSDLRILASIARADTLEVIGRIDRGITKPTHLKGKRIALTRDTAADFFLATFLSHQGIPAREVALVDLPPPAIPEAIASGAVDAAMAWEPSVWKIKERLGPNAVSWPGQSGQSYYLLLLTRDNFIKSRPRAAERLLRGLVEAEEYVSGHTAQAQEIIARRLAYNPVLLQSLWSRCEFRVRLNQDLLTLMEDEAKFSLHRRSRTGGLPNYFGIIHLGSLEKIRPEAVSIIH